MKFKAVSIGAGVVALAIGLFASHANAALIACQQISTTNNYMQVSDSYVSGCVDAGVGNINGNVLTDDFLLANPGSGYVGIGDGTFLQTTNTTSQSTGTFSIDSNLWNSWNDILIGFKFGTGNKPDEWFVYTLNNLVSSGDWSFINIGGTGGGLSHIQLYGSGPTNVPEPGTLSLLGAGFIGLAFFKRLRKQTV
jgi:hypothetical protein